MQPALDSGPWVRAVVPGRAARAAWDSNPWVRVMVLIAPLPSNCADLPPSRLLKIMNLQQIGRNYYNPSDPIDIPNHRFV